MNEDRHPLTELLTVYYNEFPKIKDEHQDEAPLTFNKSYGLYIDAPSAWPWLESIQKVVMLANQKGGTKSVIIYPSTRLYDEISDSLSEIPLAGNSVDYLSWHEIYTAMHMTGTDTRLFKAIRERISSATLCVFLGATQAPADVIDQVRGLADGCLIIMG